MAGKKKTQPVSPISQIRAQQIATNAMANEERGYKISSIQRDNDFKFLKAVINGDDPTNAVQAQRYNRYKLPTRIEELSKIYNPSNRAFKLANIGGLENLSDQAIQALLISGDLSKPKKFESTGIPAWDAAYAAMDNPSKAEKAIKFSKAHNEWESFDVKYQRLALTRAQQELGDTSIVWSDAMSQNPEVALAAASAFNNGTLKKQQLKVLNHAMEILQTLNNISMASSDQARQQIFARLSGPQQLAVVEISNALMAELEANQKKQDAQDKAYKKELKQNEGTVPERLGAGVDVIENLIGGGLGKVWDGLIWLSDNAQHAYRARFAGVTSGNLGDAFNPFSISKYWEDTDSGAMAKEDYNKLTSKYGQETVDVVRDAVQAMGAEDGWVNLLDKYKDNQAALDIIDEIILEDERGAKVSELLNEVNTLTRDDLGNMVANKVLPNEWRTGENALGKQVWNLFDVGTNAAALWFGDPTLIAGKFSKAYKIFKYGLLKNSGLGGLEKVMTRKPVQRLFNGMLDDLRKYDSIADTAEKGFYYSDVIQTKYGKYVTRDFMDDLIRYDKNYSNVYKDNVSLVTGYMREAEGVEQMLLGQPVRSANVLMPRMSASRSLLVDRYISTKKVLNFDKTERDFIRSLTPTEISQLENLLTPEEWPAYVSGLRADELLDSMIDPVLRTKIASHYGLDPESIIIKGETGLPKGGKYTEGVVKWGGTKTKRLPIGINTSRQAWYMRTDRWMRNFERMPRGKSIEIATAADSDLIYSWARTTFSKHFANNLVEHWRVMPEGQRRIFLGSMFKTIAEARGLYAMTPEISAKVDEAITSSLKYGEQYAVTMARPLGMLQDVDILASGSARAMRDVLPNLDRAAQQKISALGFRMKQVIEQRKLLAQEVKAIAYDAGVTAKRTKKETTVLEDLAEIRKTNSVNATKLKAQFDETEKELRKILKQLDDEVSSSSAVAKLANKEVSSNVRESLKSIDRKIRGLETRLGKATEVDAIKLEQELNVLKAARERLGKSNTAAYFELQKYKGIREYLQSAEGADFAFYNPAEINGRQHALHADQLSTRVTLPNYEVLQSYSVKVGILNKILGWSHGDFAKKGTDYWSSLNLVGPRYVQRAAVEDALGYAMSGGRLKDAVAGYRLSRSVREVRGKSLGVVRDRLARFAPKQVSASFEAVEPGVTKAVKSLSGKPANASYDFVQSILNDFVEATPKGKSLVEVGFSRYEPVDELKAIFDARSDAVLQYLRETGKTTFTTRKEMIHSFGEYYDRGSIGEVLELPHSKLVQQYNEAYFKLFHNLDPEDTVRLYRSVGTQGAKGTEQVGYATFDPRMALSFSRSNPDRVMVRFDVKVKDLHQPVNGSGFGDEFSMGVSLNTPILNKRVYSVEETANLIKRIPANREYRYYRGKAEDFVSIGQRNSPEFRFTFPKVEFKRIDLNDALTEVQRQEIRDAVTTLQGIRSFESPEGYLLIKAEGDQRIIQLNPKAFSGAYHEAAINAIKTIQDNLGIQLMKPIPGRTFYEWEQGLFKIDEYRAESNLLDEAQDLTTTAIQDKSKLNGLLVKENLTKDEILQADELAKLGDTSGLQRLAIKALGRRKLKIVLGRELKGIEEKALVSWIGQGNGFQLLDEVAEVPDDFIKGTVGGARYRPDMAQGKKVQYGDWTNIEATDSNFHLLWYRKIHSILHRDGSIGQITFNSLRSSDTIAQAKVKALPKIVQAINDGKVDIERYSIFNEPNMTVSEFASRYFDDSAWYFSSARGEAVNKKLIQMITRRNPETGAYFGRLYLKNEAGEIVDRIYIDDLRTGFTSADRPEFVLGRKEVVQGMTEYHDPGSLEKAWTWMADSLARVSREPIYFARYVDEYRAFQPLKQQYIANGMEEAAAEALITKLATRRAEEVAIAYMDNPAVRSIAAANVRNLARYYRATEDFYRRMLRLAKYHPEGFQKLNLLYHSFDHSGFIHTDENGNQYFIYPGTGVVNDTVAKVVNALTPGNIQIGNPFAFGGLTTMLTPSADPESWKPTFASPFASVPLKVLTSFGPFQDLEKYLLGSRGTKPAGDFFAVTREIVESTFPSHFARFFNAIAPDERNSQYASAVRGAIQILAYNGDITDDKLATVEAQTEALTKIKNVSAGILFTRFALGFILPASPQTMEKDNLTNEARKLGLKSLRPAFTQLISKYEGDLDKAVAVWYKLNPKLMPFTVAGTQGTLQAYPSLTNKAADWIKEHKDFARRHPEAAVFLMPRGGEFSFDAYAYAVGSKMIEGKTASEMFLQVITSKDYYVFMQNKEDFQKKYDATASPFQRAEYEKMWNSYRDEMYGSNPYLKQRVGTFVGKSNDGLKDRVLQDLRSSLDEIYAKGSTVPRNQSTDRVKSMLATFDDGMTEINRFSGRSDFFANGERKRLKNRLRVILQDIAGKDQNALTLYRTILDGKIN